MHRTVAIMMMLLAAGEPRLAAHAPEAGLPPLLPRAQEVATPPDT